MSKKLEEIEEIKMSRKEKRKLRNQEKKEKKRTNKLVILCSDWRNIAYSSCILLLNVFNVSENS